MAISRQREYSADATGAAPMGGGVTGVASAWRANIPMLIIGGQGPHALCDKGSLQDMNHVDLMRPITKWAHTIPTVDKVQESVRKAARKVQERKRQLDAEVAQFLQQPS